MSIEVMYFIEGLIEGLIVPPLICLLYMSTFKRSLSPKDSNHNKEVLFDKSELEDQSC